MSDPYIFNQGLIQFIFSQVVSYVMSSLNENILYFSKWIR